MKLTDEQVKNILDIWNATTWEGIDMGTAEGDYQRTISLIKENGPNHSVKANLYLPYYDYKIMLPSPIVYADDPMYKTTTKSEDIMKITVGNVPSTWRAVANIKEVIFNDPATIVYWEDGTKTVVKAHDDEFSKEHGLAMAIARKYFNGNRGSFKRTVEEAKDFSKGRGDGKAKED